MYADGMATTLGDFIRDKRDALDLSVREFARKLGDVSPAHVSDIENSRRFPSDDLLRRIAQSLGVPHTELQNLDPRPPIEKLRRMVQKDPTYGIALRKLTEKKVSSDDLLRFLNQKDKDQ